MEIIEELEPVRRGPYTGSFGYIGWNGDLDLNIMIRTLVMITGSRDILQVGAGIVADSDPAKEYRRNPAEGAGIFQRARQPLTMWIYLNDRFVKEEEAARLRLRPWLSLWRRRL